MDFYQTQIRDAIYGCEKINKPVTFQELRFALGLRPMELLRCLRDMEMEERVKTDYGMYEKVYRLDWRAFEDD